MNHKLVTCLAILWITSIGFSDTIVLPTPGDPTQANTWATMLINWLNASIAGSMYSVKTYGATGNGTTDDTAAIQAAIDAAATAEGGIVFFPLGTYALGTALTIEHPRIKLLGQKAILKPLDASLETLIDVLAMGGSSPQLVIEGFIFSGYPVSGSHTGVLIRATNGAFTDTQIQKCWFGMANSNKAAIHGRFFYSSVTDCVFEYGGAGILCDSDITTYTGSLTVQNCQFYKMTDPAIDFTDPGSGNQHGNLILSNLYIGKQASAAGAALRLMKTRAVTMNNISIDWDDIGVNPVSCQGIYIEDVNHLVASNVRMYDDAGPRTTSAQSRFGYGVYLEGDCNDIRFDQLQVLNARYGFRVSTTNDAFVYLSNSSFEGGYYHGILVYGDAVGELTLDNCTFKKYRSQALHFDTGNAVKTSIRNCRFEDMGYANATAYAILDGTGRIELAGNIFEKTDAASLGTPFITRTATDLHLSDNTFLGAVTTFSGTGGTVGQFDVTKFGALGDGVTDDSVAVKAAISAAIAADGTVFFPPGLYKVIDDGVLTHATATHLGLHMIGSGMYNSIIYFVPANANDWLWTHADSSYREQYATFENLGFRAYSSADSAGATPYHDSNANGFRLNYDSNFFFKNCMFRGFETLFKAAQATLSSSLRLEQCNISHIGEVVLHLDGTQSVDNVFTDCRLATILGDVVYVDDGGGGQVAFTNCYINTENVVGDTDKHWLINAVPGNAVVGANNNIFNFNNVRTELGSAYSCLFSTAQTNGTGFSFRINCVNCNFNPHTGADREGVNVDLETIIRFAGCNIGDWCTYDLTGDSDDIPILTFTDCSIPTALYDYITVNAYSVAIVTNCWNTTQSSENRMDFRKIGASMADYRTFTDDDTTPDTEGRSGLFKATNTNPTSITDFLEASVGQMIYVFATNGNTTIVDGSGIETFAGANFTLAADQVVSFVYDGTDWNQIASSSPGYQKIVVKTIDVDDDASTDDYHFDDDAANKTEQVITLTNILPAYAELVSWQIRCFETVTGSAAMEIDFGTSSGGVEIGMGSPDTANDIITLVGGASPSLISTNAARSLYVGGTPGANWNTLDAGRWYVAITYLDYAEAQAQ